MGLMPDELARELQGLPRHSWAPALKTVTWKDNEEAPNNDIAPLYDEVPEPNPNVDQTGIRHNLLHKCLVVLFLAISMISYVVAIVEFMTV